jgi:outer membrane receptor protein involved in Fe transport
VDRAAQTGIELLGTPGAALQHQPAHERAQGARSVTQFVPRHDGPTLAARQADTIRVRSTNSINRNTVASAWYADLAAKYDVYNNGKHTVQLFGAINNVFDKQPPFLPSFHNAIFFDNVGRYFTAGVRMAF